MPAPPKSDRFGFGMEGKVEVNVAEMKEVEKEEEIGEGVGKDEPPDENGAEPDHKVQPESECGAKVEGGHEIAR